MNVISFSLFTGLLLMTVSGPSQASSGPDRGSQLLLTDFTAEGSDLGWYVLNDNVMGGRSEGGFEQAEGELFFTGSTNTNGGGFSSIRTKAMQTDLSEHAGIRLRVMGDGRRYTWRLTTEARWRGRQVSYWADFATRDGAWSTVDIPFDRFVPKFRGYELDGPALDSSRITGMGLMIYDNQDGPFRLRLASVHAYSAPPSFALSDYRWKRRVLVVSAPSHDDPDLGRQLDMLAQAPGDLADRDMSLVKLLDDGVSAADNRELSADETAAARAALGIERETFTLRLIGKDGTVKLSADRSTPMTEIYALIDTMPMRRQEIRDR
jgi:hypothetical protein